MRGKYCKNGIIAGSVGSDCSNTWKGILYGVQLLSEGMQWRIGNGGCVKFWTDAWIPNFGPLIGHFLNPLSNEQSRENVADYFQSSEWHINKLSKVLPWCVIQRILSVHVDNEQGVRDKVIWGLSENGEFSVRSAYSIHFEDENEAIWDWNFIWKLKILLRVSHFLWVLLHGKLLSNEHRASRGLNVDIACNRCKMGCENMEHVFRGCTGTTDTWEDIWKGVSKSRSFKVDWKEWLLQNLKCSKIVIKKWPNYLIFAVSLWFIWKWRCEQVFNDNLKMPSSPGMVIMKYVDDWWNANSMRDRGTEFQICSITSEPPPVEWIKLNVDGSRNFDLGSIVAGGVFRDNNHNWLGGFAMNKGVGSALEAEMWGILEGIRIAWKAGYKKLIVETDSTVAVHLIKANSAQNHQLFSIAHACRKYMEKDCSCLIRHGYRESNRVADSLAKLGHSMDVGTVMFQKPPPQISIFLLLKYLSFLMRI
ncbi:hypothetical protein LWI29_009571 [Acer saccharum]|uniref:RNase H type-1 domain-containing protein n=1 Tax=Acer saccharum TaxID=4024 RepID=A0AA39RG45_ACESA|nr:hypothetical protein LWI29_009571 [Acer saccharum]